jgi:molybdopterin converting factor small subunit
MEFDLLTGSTVKSLVAQLVLGDRFEQLKELLLDSSTSDPRPNALILVSGREINSLNGLETVLHEGDEIALLPIAHGG